MLTFDAEAHRYEWDGRPVPHVTGILAPLTDYSRIPADTLERARQQGAAIHKMVELDIADQLAELPEWMDGYYRAWLRFRAESGFRVLASECRVYHPTMHYAGTLDLLGIAPKLKGMRGPVLIDVKRSFYAGPAIGLQTAAYAAAWDAAAPAADRVKHRFALRLDADGKYRLEPFQSANDFAVFTALLSIHRWKEQHGNA